MPSARRGWSASFPALQASVARAFVADKMSVTLTPAQFAAAKAKLLRGLPSSFIHLLEVAAAAFQPSTVPEVALLRAAILDTSPLEQVLTQAAPRTLVLPAALTSSSVTAPEAHLAAALKSFADSILQPVAPSALGGAAGGLEPDTRFVASGEEGHSSLGESLGEALHVATDAFEATADGAKFAEEAETAEAFEPAAEGFGYAFAAVAFNEANAAFGEGAGPARAAAGAAGAAVARPPTASRTSKHFPAPATRSRPPGSSPSSSRPPTTSISRSVSSASREPPTLRWTRRRR